MQPKEQLLCFIGASDKPVDPIRIMKGLFIFTKLTEQKKLPRQPRQFKFAAMSFGPCSSDVYDALEELQSEGLVKEEPVPGETWTRHVITKAGAAAVAKITKRESGKVLDFLRNLRKWCDKQSFSSLLKAVYRRWPKYARNSVLPHLRPNG